jgi:predicted metal-dependent RNase
MDTSRQNFARILEFMHREFGHNLVNAASNRLVGRSQHLMIGVNEGVRGIGINFNFYIEGCLKDTFNHDEI